MITSLKEWLPFTESISYIKIEGGIIRPVKLKRENDIASQWISEIDEKSYDCKSYKVWAPHYHDFVDKIK